MSSAQWFDQVWAMDPYSRKAVPLLLHPLTESKIISAGWHGAVGEYLGLIHGRPVISDNPEARNRFAASGVETLRQPVAIFKGLKRPLHHLYVGADEDVLAYVSRPSNTYKFIHHRDYGGVLDLQRAPIESVFVAYVSLNRVHVDGAAQAVQGLPTCWNTVAPAGVVLWWEWTPSGADGNLPLDHETRYSTRLL